ncbi:MAG TPA: hypothetical protein VGQ11_01925 [Candidatus Acidoferrales bacterium]|nr:hypothetical protein [Candidatus Acidoferrales bacterium]
MRLLRLLSLAVFLAALSFCPAMAQEHQHPAGDPEKLGQVSFPVSCSPAAQQPFNRAMAMLHSFWYARAEQEFRAVAEKDPACAMAHWGVAITHYRLLWEYPSADDLAAGAAAIQKAETAGAKTERERDFIAALKMYYEDADKIDRDTRAAKYEKAMESLFAKYPEDPEAGLFYSLTLLRYGAPPDKNYTKPQKAGAIAEKVFRAQPNHPGAAHYVIHSYDYPPLAARALNAAREYGKIAPDAPHALHMPSHIFTRLGLWDESIGSNAASAAAAQKHNLPGDELHAMDYLMYAYLQKGQDRKAAELLASMPPVKLGEPAAFAGFFARAAMPARYVLERKRWADAAKLEAPANLFPGGRWTWAEATFIFARGLGAARSGQPAMARESITKLANAQKTLLENKEPYWANQVDLQRQIVSAWLAFAEGKGDEALKMMRAAADAEDVTDKHPVTPGSILPARELLGEVLLELKRPADALPEFETVLKAAPARFNAIYGAGRAAQLAGNDAKARDYFAKLVQLGRDADSERAELTAAKNFLATNAKTGASRE